MKTCHFPLTVALLAPALLLLLPGDLPAAEPVAGPRPADFCTSDLKTDYRVNPLGLETRHLRFSWQVSEGDQSAWQVQVAGSAEKLEAGEADLWDSGRREGEATAQVAYEGTPLAARQRAWWRVRAWDTKGRESPWSAAAWLEMGLLDDSDWQGAEWIGCTRDHSAPQPVPDGMMGDWIEPPVREPVLSLYKDIELPDKLVVRAMAWWGLSKMSGPVAMVANFDRRTGEQQSPLRRIMSPRPTGFVDLAFYMEPGRTNRIELRLERPGRNFAASLGMQIVFADGTEMRLASGADWQTRSPKEGAAPRPVRVAEPYGGGRYGKVNQFQQTSLPPAWFRKKVEVRGGLSRARLYLCALGQGQAHVNGAPVDDSLLAPPQSDYEELAFYTTHDITGLLKPGANALAVLLDGGWYHEVGGFGTVFSYGRPGLKALVALDYEGGKTEWVRSGPGWQWKEGPIRAANIYRGEEVDFRRDHDEWKSADGGTGWQAVQVLPPLTPRTATMDILPVRRDGELRPTRTWQTGPTTWLFDVGEMIHGWVKLTVDEPAGTSVRLRYSEFARDGAMENVPRSQWWCHGVMQGDLVIADGRPRVFEPTFTPKSFRFVEVSGTSRQPDDLVAVPVHSGSPALARFESSDPMLNRLYANGMRTFRNYMNNILGDIPRERDLWGAESIYSAVPAGYCYDWAPNHRLMNLLWWIGPMAPGDIPGNVGVGKRLATRTSSFTWSVTPVFITSKLLEHYGDIEPARTFYDKMRHFLLHSEETGEQGGTIPVPHDLGDHAPPRDIPRVPADNALIAAMVFFEAENRFARIADALGKAEDAAHARAHAEKIRETVLGHYDRQRHTFGNGTHDSLALAYGLVADGAERERLAASLAGYYRANGHQFDGGFMSYEIYPQLSKFGYVDDALTMLVNPEPPGPARSVAQYDATSFWEAYYLDHDFQMHRGLDFIAFAHSIGWMLTDLAGIR
ncbi:MAG: family 78 glycoside hydrolase catalytic domain, partial [Thermoguttaceae bacterium]